MGFANTKHVDNCDQIKIDDFDISNIIGEGDQFEVAKHYIKRWMNLLQLGKSTTCVYQFLVDDCFENASPDIIQYFLLDGLFLCVRMGSHVCHMFYGHTFSHRTSVGIAIINGMVHYNHNNINIFAWGGT